MGICLSLYVVICWWSYLFRWLEVWPVGTPCGWCSLSLSFFKRFLTPGTGCSRLIHVLPVQPWKRPRGCYWRIPLVIVFLLFCFYCCPAGTLQCKPHNNLLGGLCSCSLCDLLKKKGKRSPCRLSFSNSGRELKEVLQLRSES